MKFTYSLLLIAYPFFILSACKRQKSTSHSTAVLLNSGSSGLPAFSTPVTAAQVADLNSLWSHGKINNALDFKKAVDSLKSLAVEKKPAPPDNASTHEEIYYASIDNWQPADRVVHDTVSKTINSRIECRLTFGTRGNQIKVLVPFKYDCKTNPAGKNAIANIQPANRVQLIPMDLYGKNLTQSETWHLNAGFKNATWQEAAEIEAFGSAQEKRTTITSTNGKVILSTRTDDEVFKYGTELEDGFTVNSAGYVYNQYSITAWGKISIRDEKSNNFIPYTQFYGIIKAEQFGTLKNQ